MLLFSISNRRSLRLTPAYPDFSFLCRMILGHGRHRIGWQLLPSGLVARISPQYELEDGTTAAVPNENKRNPRVSLGGDNPTFKENLGILRTPLPSQLWPGRSRILYQLGGALQGEVDLGVGGRLARPIGLGLPAPDK